MVCSLSSAGGMSAQSGLDKLLAQRGDLDQLRSRADVDDSRAPWHLADLLTKHGNLNEAEQILQKLADSGDAPGPLADQLSDLLKKPGRREEAERLRRFGLNPEGSVADG
jgi:hypothetical protein